MELKLIKTRCLDQDVEVLYEHAFKVDLSNTPSESGGFYWNLGEGALSASNYYHLSVQVFR